MASQPTPLTYPPKKYSLMIMAYKPLVFLNKAVTLNPYFVSRGRVSHFPPQKNIELSVFRNQLPVRVVQDFLFANSKCRANLIQEMLTCIGFDV